jgi:hypothetical protein
MTMRSARGRTPLLLVLLLACFAAPVAAQSAPPSPEEHLGYPLGRHFTDHAGVRDYVRTLATASPRVEYRVYGITPERRDLIQLIVSTPANLARLDAILAANEELTRPGTSAARARQIAASNPAVVFFSYGVHGNESSSSEAAMWTAWDLARSAEGLEGVLDSLVVIIDPVANPDGRDRYVNWFRSVVGARPNPSPQAREHREPWPGGRFNHYLFDLNRDWAWATQPETQARLATWWRFNPQVHVDFHEMGYNSSYFFFPAAEPINPLYPEYVLRWGRRFGEANAAAFDSRGWAYFTGEAFDLFYPGYGDSWPSLTGAIGMTYEQAGHGMAGLTVERAEGDTLTLHQRAQQHRTAGHATLRAAATGKTQLLEDFAAGHRTFGAGMADILLVGEGPRVEELIAHLRRQGIEVERATRAFSGRATPYPGFERRTSFPAGSHLVRIRQPRGRLAATLLQPEVDLRAEYSYDISAWSLPYAYGVEAHRISAPPAAGWERAPLPITGSVAAAEPGYGYLVPAGEAPARAVIAFLRDGGRARVLSRASTHAGREWPAGSWFIPALGNEGLQRRATEAGLGRWAVSVRGGMSEGGIDLGSNRAIPVSLPRVAVISGDGVSPTSFGAHWFYLEQRLDLDFDAVQAADIGRLDLGRYDVIVIPDAAPRALTEGAITALRGWVQGGGRLIGVAGGSEMAAGIAGVELRAAEEPAGDSRVRFLRGREERERDAWRDEVPGTILQLQVDPAHPLAWGAGLPGRPQRLFALQTGTRLFEPSSTAETVAFYPTDVRRISGVIGAESLRRLEEGAWLVTSRQGRGSVVLFAEDPLFRLLWKGTEPLYVNAILLGP